MVNEKKDEETSPAANQFEKLAIAGEKSALYMQQ